MANGNERGHGMRDLSRESVAAANEALKDEELALVMGDKNRLESLRPQFTTDAADFERLLQAVNEATQRNESAAALRDRLEALGKGVLAVAGKVVKLL